MKKSQSIEKRGIPYNRIACPPTSKYRTPAEFNAWSSSSIVVRRPRHLEQQLLLPFVHLQMGPEFLWGKLGKARTGRQRDNLRIINPQSKFSPVVIFQFHPGAVSLRHQTLSTVG
jgi:hypothetical protein